MGVVVQRRQLTGRGRAHNETGASSARESSSSSTAAQRQHNSAHARQQQRRRLDVCQQTPAQRVWRAQGSGKKTKNRKQQVRCCLWLLGAQRRRWWENGAARVCVCVCVCAERGGAHRGKGVGSRTVQHTTVFLSWGSAEKERGGEGGSAPRCRSAPPPLLFTSNQSRSTSTNSPYSSVVSTSRRVTT